MSHPSDEGESNSITGEEFLQIKKCRIMERRKITEATRQHDLQRIRDMKSKNGIHPLDLFPKEIWEKILDPLSPNDLGNVYGVHESFQTILEHRKIRDVLFPQILKLEKFTPFWKPNRVDKENSKPSGLAEFSKLRQVSKSLKNAIDEWHESQILENLYSPDEVQIASFACTFPGEAEEYEMLDGILANFSSVDDTRARQFFLRYLKVNIEGGMVDDDWHWTWDPYNVADAEAFSKFQDKVRSLLELIGSQIWHFEFKITDMNYLDQRKDLRINRIYSALKEWIDLMPNVKWFVLDNEGESNAFPSQIPSDFFQRQTFPHLDNLIRLSCVFNSDNYDAIFGIFSNVLGANQHVKALSVILEDQTEEEFFLEHLNLLLESQPLELDMFSINPMKIDAVPSFDCVQLSINLSWPLRALHLAVDMSLHSSLKAVFNCLENFPTLENLTLGIAHEKFEQDIPFLRLPNLTHLKLEVTYYRYFMEFTSAMNFFLSLKFLLYAKKLKKLVWKLDFWEDHIDSLTRLLIKNESGEECVDFRAGLRDIRSCNLWDLFPKLEDVEVEILKYGDDEAYHKQKWGFEVDDRRKDVFRYRRGEKL